MGTGRQSLMAMSAAVGLSRKARAPPSESSFLAKGSGVDPVRDPRNGARLMSPALPPCPYLPTPRAGLDWRSLHAYRDQERGADFYFGCLEYGHALWQRGLAARALLCLDRAFGAELSGQEPILQSWEMPYAATAWMIARTPDGVFIGNPRVHFQHYADRMNEPRREQRRWRAWACWALTRAVAPGLPGDPRHVVTEPSAMQIESALEANGLPGEVAVWRAALDLAAGMKA